MFTCTDSAADLIRTLLDAADLPDRAGLRLALDPTTWSLAMSLAPGPVEYDRVHAHGDVRVFLAPSALPRLDRRVLDAEVSEGARAFFLVDR
jgi:iron-sulfur cluster assembly protein